MFFIGCTTEDYFKDTAHQFTPTSFLRSELQDQNRSAKPESVIIPDDLDSRPDLKECITTAVTIADADSNLAALDYINQVIEKNAEAKDSKAKSDLLVIKATMQFALTDYPASLNSCDEAIAADPRNWRAYHFRAMLREKNNDSGWSNDYARASQLKGGKPIRKLSMTGFVI